MRNLFGETLADLRIRNGTRGTVDGIQIGPDGHPWLRMTLDDGRCLEQPWSAFARQPKFGKPRPPRVVHAYAGTAYSAQGRTAAATVHYISSATDARETYVALTRHRSDVRIVVERDRIDALCRQRQADPRIAPTVSSIEERLFKEASQYSEKANVVDFVADRTAFIESGRISRPDERHGTLSCRYAHAGRVLKNALRALAARNGILQRWHLNYIHRPKPSVLRLQTILKRLRRSPARIQRSQAILPDHGNAPEGRLV